MTIMEVNKYVYAHMTELTIAPDINMPNAIYPEVEIVMINDNSQN